MDRNKLANIIEMVVIVVVNVEASFLSFIINNMHQYTIGYERSVFVIFEAQAYLVLFLFLVGFLFSLDKKYFVYFTLLNVVSVVGGAVDYWMLVR